MHINQYVSMYLFCDSFITPSKFMIIYNYFNNLNIIILSEFSAERRQRPVLTEASSNKADGQKA